MPVAQQTRQRIIEMADQLFYQKGYDHCSFADIAQAVGLSRGNFYYHFKTKDAILQAVIEFRAKKTLALLQQWTQQTHTASARIGQFIDLMTMNRRQIQRYGCPVGSLCAELAKLNHPALPEAQALFTLFRQWLLQQFEQLGFNNTADTLAMHLLARSQGIALLAQAFHDEAFIQAEVEQLHDWLNSMDPQRQSSA